MLRKVGGVILGATAQQVSASKLCQHAQHANVMITTIFRVGAKNMASVVSMDTAACTSWSSRHVTGTAGCCTASKLLPSTKSIACPKSRRWFATSPYRKTPNTGIARGTTSTKPHARTTRHCWWLRWTIGFQTNNSNRWWFGGSRICEPQH